MSQGFEKNQSKPSQKKKVIVLVVLSAVLAGVWIHYGSSNMPQTASAQGGDGAAPVDPALLAPPKQAADAIRELSDDPTRDLLRGNRNPAAEFDQAPQNPFAMNDNWRAALTKPEPVANPVHTDATTEPATFIAPPTPRVVAVVNVEAIKLQGIIRDAKRKLAIINGSIMNVGGIVHGARIVEILDDRIRVVPVSAPDAAVVEILVKNRMK